MQDLNLSTNTKALQEVTELSTQVDVMARFKPIKVNGFYQILDSEVSKFIAMPDKKTGTLKVIRKKTVVGLGKIMANLQIAMEQHEKNKQKG